MKKREGGKKQKGFFPHFSMAMLCLSLISLLQSLFTNKFTYCMSTAHICTYMSSRAFSDFQITTINFIIDLCKLHLHIKLNSKFIILHL